MNLTRLLRMELPGLRINRDESRSQYKCSDFGVFYAEALDGSVSHFRDKNGLECDAVLHRRDGRYGLIEIKLGSEKGIQDDVKTLTTFSKKIDTDAMRSPSFLMILTASGDFAYRRDDGIWVVPIGCLKP